MKRLIIAVAMMFAAAVAFAQGAEIVKVRGKGTGVDKTEALKDATEIRVASFAQLVI